MQLDCEHMMYFDQMDLADKARSFKREFDREEGMYELHEKVLKPALDIRVGLSVGEIGVGGGEHLASYSGLDYYGCDIDPQEVLDSKENAEKYGISSDRIRLRDSKGIPFPEHGIDRLFSVCVLHEAEDMEAELAEMERVLNRNGRLAIVERMCALGEKSREIENLKREPELVGRWLGERGYACEERRFECTVWGESLTSYPKFPYWMILAHKL